MIALENPPGFVVRTEAQQAAWVNGFRLERGLEGGWLHYGSTTASGTISIAGASLRGPWLLSIGHLGVIVEVGDLPPSPVAGPGAASYLRGKHRTIPLLKRLERSSVAYMWSA
jgi:hypothetical protein